MVSASSEPKAHANADGRLLRVFACLARDRRCFAELSFPNRVDIRRKLARDFVAKLKTQLELRKPRADTELRDVLGKHVQLPMRLSDQALREQEVEALLQPC